jgi:hypothetical protein
VIALTEEVLLGNLGSKNARHAPEMPPTLRSLSRLRLRSEVVGRSGFQSYLADTSY